MICKWCGATIKVTNGKCQSCGRDIPPISDCGGFYNVAPKATRETEQKSVTDYPKKQAEPELERAQSVLCENRPAPEKRTNILPFTIAAFLFAVIGIFLLLQVMVLNKRLSSLERAQVQADSSAGELAKRVDSVDSHISSVEQQLIELDGRIQDVTEPTEPEPEPEPEPKLAEQFLSFAVSGGKLTASTPSTEIIDIDNSYPGTAVCSIDGERLWEAKLFEKEQDPLAFDPDRVFVFHYDIASEELGAFQSSVFVWSFRTQENPQWEEFAPGEDGYQQEDNPSDSSSIITVYSEWLAQTAPDGKIEFRCVVERKNTAGGSLVIDFSARIEDLAFTNLEQQ